MSWGTFGISSEGHFLGRAGKRKPGSPTRPHSAHAQKRVVQEAGAGLVLGEVSLHLPRQPALHLLPSAGRRRG